MSDKRSSIFNIIADKADQWPDQRVFTFLSGNETEVETLTYGDLLNRCTTRASQIQHKVTPGQRVLLISQNQSDFIISFLACLMTGVIAVPAQTPRRNKKDTKLGSMIQDSSPVLIMAEHEVYEKSARHNPFLNDIQWLFTDKPDHQTNTFEPIELTAETPAMIQYTSGTLAEPKGVLLSHGNIMSNSAAIRYAMALEEHSSFVSWVPHYHDMGLFGSILEPIISQVPAILLSPLDFAKKPIIWLRAISKYKATISGAPNFGYQHCIDRVKAEDCLGLDLSHWKVAYCGAELVRASTLRKFNDRFAAYGFRDSAFMPCYGMAEATLMITCGNYEDAIKTARYPQNTTEPEHGKEVVSCGRIPENTNLQIVNGSEPAEEGAVGEIWFKGQNVASGYWNNETETLKNFHHSIKGEAGFLKTGDLGFLKDGELYLTGRLKEMVIIRGNNFYPQDIEGIAALSNNMLAANQSAAFSVEGQEERLVILQEVKRSFWTTPDYEQIIQDMVKAISSELELTPDTVAILKPGALPRTSSGKISRLGARKGFIDQSFEYLHIECFAPNTIATASETTPEGSVTKVEHEIMTLLKSALESSETEVRPDSSVFDLGIDSVAAVDLVASIEEHFDIDLDASLLWQFETVEEISDYIFEHKLNCDDLESV